MADILEFKRPDKHIGSIAVCLNCKHEWAGVREIGQQGPMQCPECGSFKGHWKLHLVGADNLWHCSICSEFLFSITLIENTPCLVCANCGNYSNALDLFNHD